MGWSFQWRPLGPDRDDPSVDPSAGRADKDVYPQRNTEEVRDKQPGTRTREEIKQREGYRKQP
jgi:hypothetical protein